MGKTTKEPKEQKAQKAPEQESQQETQAPEQEPQQEEVKQEPDSMVMVEVVQTYKDLELNRYVNKGEHLPMLPERAAVIIGKALGKAVEE